MAQHGLHLMSECLLVKKISLRNTDHEGRSVDVDIEAELPIMLQVGA